MTKLHLGNGTILSVFEASVLCGQCHEGIYYEWKRSFHGVTFTVPTTANQVLISFVSFPPLPVYMFIATLGILIGAVFVNRRFRNDQSE